ncbi:SDR family oxidoreductase [Nocardia sp. NBC_00508]|uniref:SDR family NAD(P)-dependent oxidoreductase n=1 Tax=Nocardia sp. NBC_00508 TaxID=2975992 RepID=UPI002E808FA7|nr:SDR family oxidoreductase [Nocardia sp. NBC_00508]WUD63746.1 SDR family oxidoreductase [Nocardia sp. NBC_00508]
MKTWDGATAVVTGASSGIGAAFATALAERHCNLILVARREHRLRKLATDLEHTFGVRARILTADLSIPADVERLVAVLSADDNPIDLLVNNAGFATHGPLVDDDPARMREEIAVNITAVAELTRAILPDMVRRGAGAVVNIASTAAFQPIPFMAVYGATKAFVLSFTEALWGELEGSGVTALAVCPGATDTEFFDVAGEAASVGRRQTAAQVVAKALGELDRRAPRPSVVSGLANAVSARLPRYLPRRTTIRLTRGLVAAK